MGRAQKNVRRGEGGKKSMKKPMPKSTKQKKPANDASGMY